MNHIGPAARTPWEQLVSALRRAVQAQKRRGYTLGWVFVCFQAQRGLSGWSAVLAGANWPPENLQETVAWSLSLLGLACITITGLAASLRRPWCWYSLIVGIPADVVLQAGSFAHLWGYMASFPQDLYAQVLVGMVRRRGLVAAGLIVLNALWFPYFYRRAGRFGARGQLGWLVPRALRRPLAVPGPKLLGLSWAAWLLIAIAITLVTLSRVGPFS